MPNRKAEHITPRISGSRLGDHNKILLGKHQEVNNIYNFASTEPGSSTDSELLEILSAEDPAIDKATIQNIDDSLQIHALNETLDSEDIEKWMESVGPRVLWIQDESKRGHGIFTAKLVDRILVRQQQEQQPAGTDGASILAYSFSQRMAREPRAISHMLKAITYCLLAQDPVALSKSSSQYTRQLSKRIGQAEEFYLLKSILRDTLAYLTSKKSRVYLVVDGLEYLAKGDSDHDAYEVLRALLGHAPLVRLAIVGNVPLRKRHRQFPVPSKEIELPLAVIADLWALGAATDLVMQCGKKMAHVYELLKRASMSTSKSSSWLPYTRKGSLWLRSPSPIDPVLSKVLWHSPGRKHELRPSVLSLQVTDIFGERSEDFRTAFVSFFYAKLPNKSPHVAPKDKLEPGLGLWFLFTHLAWENSPTKEDLILFLLKLPRPLMSLVRDMCSIIASQEHDFLNVESEMPSDDEIENFDLQSTAQLVEWIPHKSWNNCFDASFHEGLANLIIEAVKDGAAKSVCLVIDSFDLVDVKLMAACLDLIRPALERVSTTRLLLSGTHGAEDESQLRMRTSLLQGNPLNKDTEYEECLESLYFDKIHFRRNIVPNALHNTTEWLWTSPAYDAWAKGGGVLWICGKPGSGKSVLAKTIVNNFDDSESQHPVAGTKIVCSWFYSRRDDDIGTAHTSMLRTLVYEILHGSKLSYKSVRKYYRQHLHQADGPRTPAKETSWDDRDLCAILEALSNCSTTPETLAIVDGIDESQDGLRRREILQLLFRIGSIIARRIRVIALSRPEPNIEDAFSQCRRITMQDHNSEDIKMLVDSKFKVLRHVWLLSTNEAYRMAHSIDSGQMEFGAMAFLPPAQVDESMSVIRLPEHEEAEISTIREYLIRKADGVFLWVHLILEQLLSYLQDQDNAKITLLGLRQLVTCLPTELYALYEFMLKSLGLHEDTEKLAATRRMFMWIIGASTWKHLELRDLLDAMAVPEPGDSPLPSTFEHDKDDPILLRRFSVGDNWNRLRKIIYQHCGPFVDLVEETRTTDASPTTFGRNWKSKPNWTLQLLHQTVLSFLEDPSYSGGLCIKPGAARTFVLARSFTYLQLVLPSRPKAYLPQATLDASPPFVVMPIDIITEPRRVTSTLAYESIASLVAQDEQPASMMSLNKVSAKKAWLNWFNYLESRPLTRFALSVLSQSEEADSTRWIGESIIRGEEDAMIINTFFPLWWVARSYHVDQQFQTSDVLRKFAEYACQYGYEISTEIIVCFMDLIKTRYPDWREHSQQSRWKCAQSLVLGVVDGFLQVAKAHPHYCFPFCSSLLHHYDRLSGNGMDKCSAESLFDSESGHYEPRDRKQDNSDPIRLELLKIETRDTGKNDASSIYEKHCQFQELVLKDHSERDVRVPVWKFHHVISTIVKYIEDVQPVDEGWRSIEDSYKLDLIPGNDVIYRFWDTCAKGSHVAEADSSSDIILNPFVE